MAGIKITKKYIPVNTNLPTIANNWSVLVLGVTTSGTTTPTLVNSYNEFIKPKNFGPPADINNPGITYQYVRALLDSGVPVLFKRIVDDSVEAINAKLSFKLTDSTTSKSKQWFTVVAKDQYKGKIGNDITVTIGNEYKGVPVSGGSDSYEAYIRISYLSNNEYYGVRVSDNSISTTINALNIYVENNITNINSKSQLINIIEYENIDYIPSYTEENTNFLNKEQKLTGGVGNVSDYETALELLSDSNSSLYQDKRLKHAMMYYPQLRFITTGGIIGNTIGAQNTILKNLGLFAVNCGSTFKVLVDYAMDMTDPDVVRGFISGDSEKSPNPLNGVVSGSNFAYFGFWGVDNTTGVWLPGSVGFLTALANSGYNVYNRRIAGSGFRPSFSKMSQDIYLDEYADWQDEEKIQLNPIMVVDAYDNLAVMGSSTLISPLSPYQKNPEQALDVVLITDYVTAILSNIAFSSLEMALDRLGLTAISNLMTTELDRFVTSGAITRYDLDFDTTILGKLGVTCTLYFAIGLEEVSLTISSTYDTTSLTVTTEEE